jgi:hypothetical protein
VDGGLAVSASSFTNLTPSGGERAWDLAVNGSDLWLVTLGGGTWQVYNTSNSLLPEDDVLAVAIDANGGQWFATFDIGLTYHGSLPATPPTLDLAPWRAPEYGPAVPKVTTSG